MRVVSTRTVVRSIAAASFAVVGLAGCADQYIGPAQVMREDVKVALTPAVIEALAGQTMEFGDGAAISPKLKGQPLTLTFGGSAEAPKGTMVLSSGGKQIGTMQLTAAASKSGSCTLYISWNVEAPGDLTKETQIEINLCNISFDTKGKAQGTFTTSYSFFSGKDKVTITIVFRKDGSNIADIYIGKISVGTGQYTPVTGTGST